MEKKKRGERVKRGCWRENKWPGHENQRLGIRIGVLVAFHARSESVTRGASETTRGAS